MSNSWDDSSCYLNSCHKILVSPQESRTPGFSYTLRKRNPVASGLTSLKSNNLKKKKEEEEEEKLASCAVNIPGSKAHAENVFSYEQQHTASDILSRTGRFCLGPFDLTMIIRILMRLQHTASDTVSRTGRFCLGPFDVTVIIRILMRLQHTASDIVSRTGRFCLGPFDVTMIIRILMRLQHTASNIVSRTGRFCLGPFDVTGLYAFL
ncbi:hypothetical protein ANN_17036 [Periplaneta americana]|uniref:Uncharacterized protein n=1 Tax=Periplaneta americana TaxID=6978 RepID=A0ABQ8SRS6_PERAM|nr:hypothetical protein ANN_17036 [Periplaneta americana]